MSDSCVRAWILVVCLGIAADCHAQTDIEKLVEQSGIETAARPLRDLVDWREPEKIIVRDREDVAAQIRSLFPQLEVVAIGSSGEAGRHLEGAAALIGYCVPELVASATELLWVQIYSAGAERCLAAERIRNGDVVLTNMQKMDAPVIAEHVMAMVLALAREVVPYAKSMPSGAWRDSPDSIRRIDSIAGKTLLVAGLGGIGTEVARRAAALDMRVTGTRRSSRSAPDFVSYVGLSDELIALAGEADFIVNALPFTSETEGLFDSRFFDSVKAGAYFINVGRGRTVITDDLYRALKAGRLAGIGLDVTDPEPLPAQHPLWQEPNVIITPHVAGEGGNWARKRTLLLENLRRFVAGDALYNVVDPQLGY